MTEPRVVAHREQLWWLLAEAAQLEHMIMCEYLYAEFSLKNGSGGGLTAGQAEAVGRWRTTLHEIAVQEMLHLALVSNLMTAIGAAPVFGRPNFPQRSGYFPAGVQLDLLPFGEQALRHYLFLERPEGMELGREPAWALLHERSAFLTHRYAQTTSAHQAVHDAHQRAAVITAAIAAHVPVGLLPSGAALAAGDRH